MRKFKHTAFTFDQVPRQDNSKLTGYLSLCGTIPESRSSSTRISVSQEAVRGLRYESVYSAAPPVVRSAVRNRIGERYADRVVLLRSLQFSRSLS